MRAVMVFAVLVASLTLPSPALADEENVTCRIDAVAVGAALDAEIGCLQADPETYGEFDGAVTVTIQVAGPEGWVDAATETCTGGSTRGVMELNCSVTAPDAADRDVRGLIDLAAPMNWSPAIAQPTYMGGPPIDNALAEDDCDLNETVEASDLTASDPPWVDLCAITMDADVDEDGNVTAVSVTTHVAGGLQERTPTGYWLAQLDMASGCSHDVSVADSGGLGSATVAIDSQCEYTPGECTGVIKLITDVLGGGCSSSGTWAHQEQVVLPAESVEFRGSEVVVTFEPAQLSPLLGAEFAAGQTIARATGVSATGVSPSEGGDARSAALDTDTSASTGRTFTIGE